MEYIDLHHKRTDFSADSFSAQVDGAGDRISFVGRGQHGSVALLARDADLVAVVPESDLTFVLRKIQILEGLKRLTLDFTGNPLLSRIVIHIEHLDMERLDAAIQSLIDARSVLYFRH